MLHYDHFKKEKIIRLIEKARTDGASEEQIRVGEIMLGHVTLFEHAGRIVVEISPLMQSVFGAIDLSPVRREEVFLPHKSVYFDLPGGVFSLSAPPGSAGPHTIQGLYVTRVHDVNHWGVIIPGESWQLFIWTRRGNEEAFFRFSFFWDGTPSVIDDSSLETRITSYVQSGDANEYSATDLVAIRQVIRTVINAILYWTSPEAAFDIDCSSEAKARRFEADLARAKSSGKKKEIQRALDRVSRVKIVRFRIKPAPDTETEGTRSPVRRHKVAAHWHHFWVGPTHALWDVARETREVEGFPRQRIRRLVLEFWRGEASAGRIVSRVHRLNGEEKPRV